MKVTAKTPRVAGTIQKTQVQFPEPFAEGHTCTAGEAAALNQTLRENARNALAKQVKEKPGEAQALVDNWITDYEITAGSGRTRDPLEVEALSIAQHVISKKMPEATKAAVKEKAKEALAHPEYGPKLREKAAERLKEAETLGDIF